MSEHSLSLARVVSALVEESPVLLSKLLTRCGLAAKIEHSPPVPLASELGNLSGVSPRGAPPLVVPSRVAPDPRSMV